MEAHMRQSILFFPNKPFYFAPALLFLTATITTAQARPDTFRIAQSARWADGSGVKAQGERVVKVLELGKPIERELGGSDTHSYRITLTEGQFLRAVFEQRGVNLIITLYGPDEKKIGEVDSPVGSQGQEPVSLVAETSGSYRLEARAGQESAPKGRYAVMVKELRAATPQDKTRIAAERTYAEATLVSGQGTAESMRKAIEKYLEAVPLWQALGDRQQEAFTLIA